MSDTCEHDWSPAYTYIEEQFDGTLVRVKGWHCQRCDGAGETYSVAEPPKEDWSDDLDRYIDRQLKEIGR
jgi:hypothetical protein